MSTLLIDYAVFGLLILGTFGFNVYNNASGPKEKTKADYVFAKGRSTSNWAMLMSIARGFLGVRVFLGYPSELFYRGSAMWETMYGMCLAFPVVAYFFVPVYFSLGITSVYQYLDLRFKSRLVRCLASGTYVIRSLLNLGVTVFTPCVALKTVIGMPYWMSIFAMITLGVIFTVTGGLRSAIMVDVMQGLAMIGCSIAIIIQGMFTVPGGPASVVTKPLDGGRLDFFNFNLDPTLRVTTVSALVGQFFISLSLYGCQQSFVQRYLSMKSEQRVIRVLWYNVPFMAVLMSLSWIVGLVIFAHYADCDPRQLGYITDIDEILPFYVEDKFYFLPGFLGLTMAVLFNGGLSFFVSNLNSISTAVWEDFLLHLKPMKNLSDEKQLFMIKVVGAVLGLSIGGLAFMVSFFSGVIESSMLLTSATSGPLLGVFLLAMFVPAANWKGASVGMIASHVLVLWITLGALTIEKPQVQFLRTTINECTNDTFSQIISPISAASHKADLESSLSPTYQMELDNLVLAGNEDLIQIMPTSSSDDFLTSIYKMTYMYYALFGTVITVLIGTVVSYLTGIDESYSYDDTLLHPIVRKIRSWLPGQRNCFTAECTKTTKNVPSVSNKTQKFSLTTINEKASPEISCYKNDAFTTESTISNMGNASNEKEER